MLEGMTTWNREFFSWVDLKVSEEVEIINDMENLLVDNFGGNIDSLVSTRREATSEFWKCLFMKESMLRLKSKQLWLKDGDKNSRYFHNSLKERQRKNAISVLEGEDGRVEGVEEAKVEVKNHFENFFKEEDFNKVVVEGLGFNCLSENDRSWLERPFMV